MKILESLKIKEDCFNPELYNFIENNIFIYNKEHYGVALKIQLDKDENEDQVIEDFLDKYKLHTTYLEKEDDNIILEVCSSLGSIKERKKTIEDILALI